MAIGNPCKHKENKRQHFDMGDRPGRRPHPRRSAGSMGEQEGGDFWGRMGMLFQTMKIDLSKDWDDRLKVHRQCVGAKIMMEKDERSTAIGGITMQAEQHANAIDKDLKQIKEQMTEPRYEEDLGGVAHEGRRCRRINFLPTPTMEGDHIVVGGFDEASLPEQRVAVMMRVLMDILPEDLSQEWTSAYASGRRESKTAKVRFSGEVNAARAAFMLNVAFRKKRTLYVLDEVSRGRAPPGHRQVKENAQKGEGMAGRQDRPADHRARLRRLGALHQQCEGDAVGQLDSEVEEGGMAGQHLRAPAHRLGPTDSVTRGRSCAAGPPRTWKTLATTKARREGGFQRRVQKQRQRRQRFGAGTSDEFDENMYFDEDRQEWNLCH